MEEANVTTAARVPMTGVALDGRLDLDTVRANLGWKEMRRYAYGSSFQLPDLPDDTIHQRRVFLFKFGAVVVDGADHLDTTLIGALEGSVGARALLETKETIFLSEDTGPNARAARIGWDWVSIPLRTPEMVAAIALLVAQSVAVERYEIAGGKLIVEALEVARDFAVHGAPPRDPAALIRRIGRTAQARLELASMFFLLDKPEETWEDPTLATLYEALFDHFELRERHQAMVQKFDVVEGATDQVVSVLRTRTSNRLEWAIIWLIAVEIALTLVEKLTG